MNNTQMIQAGTLVIGTVAVLIASAKTAPQVFTTCLLYALAFLFIGFYIIF